MFFCLSLQYYLVSSQRTLGVSAKTERKPFAPDVGNATVGKSELFYLIIGFPMNIGKVFPSKDFYQSNNFPKSKNTIMKIIVNKEILEIPIGKNVAGLMKSLYQERIAGKAVALDNKVIPVDKWETTKLNENDNILIITATQGG